jgi:hypothetical protein
VGADKMADLLQRSFDQFPDKTVSVDRDRRQQVLEQIEEEAEENWGRLELEYYENEPALKAILWEYVKRNSSSF